MAGVGREHLLSAVARSRLLVGLGRGVGVWVAIVTGVVRFDKVFCELRVVNVMRYQRSMLPCWLLLLLLRWRH